MDLDLSVTLRSLDPAVLGRRIRDLRVARGLTQGQVAGEDISIAYVSRIESGQRRPDHEVLKLIADRLGTTLEYFASGLNPEVNAEATLNLRYAELALESGEAIDAEQAAGKALEQLESVPNDPRLIEARYLRARAWEALGRLDDAAIELERIREAGPDVPRWTAAMIALCRCYREGGDLDRSIDVGETALTALGELGLGHDGEAIQLRLTLAAAYFERGDEMYARKICQDAVDEAEAAGEPVARASAYWNASMMEAQRGNVLPAIGLAERALALMTEGNDARNIARLRSALAHLLLESDEPDAKGAERLLKKARRDLAASSAGKVDLLRCDLQLAEAALLQGDEVRAAELAEAALTETDLAGPLRADAHLVLGRVAMSARRSAAARKHFQAAAAALSESGRDRAAAAAWFQLGALLDELGEAELARDAYRSAAAAGGVQVPTARRARVLLPR